MVSSTTVVYKSNIDIASINSIISYLGLVGSAILVVGVVFNLLAALIFARTRFSRSTMGFFYTGYSFVCAFSVANGVLMYLPLYLGHDPTATSQAACKLIWFVRRVSVQYVSWFEVFITFERTAKICYPTRFRFMTKRQNLVVLLGATLLVICTCDITYFFYGLVENPSNNATLVCKPADLVNAILSDTTSTILRNIVPFVLLVLMNALIWRTIASSRKVSSGSSKSARDQEFAMTIVTLNSIFLVTHLPVTIVLNVQNVFKYLASSSAELLAVVNILYYFTFYVAYCYEASTFPLMASFNRLFRSELCVIVFHGRYVASPTSTSYTKSKTVSILDKTNNN